MNIRSYLKNKMKDRRKDRISSISMRDILTRSSKKDVINYAYSYIKTDAYDEIISEIISFDENYVCPIGDIDYISQIYDLLYKEALESSVYDTSEFFLDNYNGFPFGFGEFIDLRDIETGCSCSSRFIEGLDTDNKQEMLSIYFIMDCKIHNELLSRGDVHIVAMFILQFIYIDEENKIYQS